MGRSWIGILPWIGIGIGLWHAVRYARASTRVRIVQYTCGPTTSTRVLEQVYCTRRYCMSLPAVPVALGNIVSGIEYLEYTTLACIQHPTHWQNMPVLEYRYSMVLRVACYRHSCTYTCVRTRVLKCTVLYTRVACSGILASANEWCNAH